jgi:predicted dehydrogenase
MEIGIMGCGKIAQTHAKILQTHLDEPRLIFCDRNKDRAVKASERFFPGPAYESVDDLLSKEKVDAVHVLTQIHSHYSLAEKVLEAGAHVYIEKPIVEKPSEYASLCAISKSKDRCLCSGYSALGFPVIQQAKRIIESSEYGNLITVHCDFNWSAPGNSLPYGGPEHWAYQLKGGIIQNLADHPASLIVDVMNKISELNVMFGYRNPLPNDYPDQLHFSVKADGQIGSGTLSFGHGNTYGQVSYYLEAATILVDLRRQLLAVQSGKGPQSGYEKLHSGMRLSWDLGWATLGNFGKRITGSLQREPGIAGLIHNFYRAIEGKEKLIVSDETATGAISLLDQIWEDMGSISSSQSIA